MQNLVRAIDLSFTNKKRDGGHEQLKASYLRKAKIRAVTYSNQIEGNHLEWRKLKTWQA